MTYLMSGKMYWGYINSGMTHEDLIAYLNRTLLLRGVIEAVEITEVNI